MPADAAEPEHQVAQLTSPRAPAATVPTRRRPAGPLVVTLTAGIASLVAAAVIGLDTLVALPGSVLGWAAATALGVIGVALVLVGLAGRRGGGLIGLAIISLLIAGATAGPVTTDLLPGPQEDVRWAPTGDVGYQLDFGSATLDLTGLPPEDATQVSAEVSIGSLVILVPEDATVEYDLSSELGEIRGLDGVAHDAGSQSLRTHPDRPDVVVQARVDIGDIEVRTVTS